MHKCMIFDAVINVKNVEVMKAFGKKLRTLRIARDLSQEQLANLAEIPLSQVGRIERGEINTTISTMSALAVALELSLYELFTPN